MNYLLSFVIYFIPYPWLNEFIIFLKTLANLAKYLLFNIYIGFSTKNTYY